MKKALCLAIAAVALLGFLLPHEGEFHYLWQRVPVFDLIFGFLGCLLLILFSKALGHHWLQRPEDYYD